MQFAIIVHTKLKRLDEYDYARFWVPTINRADLFKNVLVGAHQQHLQRMLFKLPPGEGTFGET